MGANDTLEQLRAAQAYAVDLEATNAALVGVIVQARAVLDADDLDGLSAREILYSAGTDVALRKHDAELLGWAASTAEGYLAGREWLPESRDLAELIREGRDDG